MRSAIVDRNEDEIKRLIRTTDTSSETLAQVAAKHLSGNLLFETLKSLSASKESIAPYLLANRSLRDIQRVLEEWPEISLVGVREYALSQGNLDIVRYVESLTSLDYDYQALLEASRKPNRELLEYVASKIEGQIDRFTLLRIISTRSPLTMAVIVQRLTKSQLDEALKQSLGTIVDERNPIIDVLLDEYDRRDVLPPSIALDIAVGNGDVLSVQRMASVPIRDSTVVAASTSSDMLNYLIDRSYRVQDLDLFAYDISANQIQPPELEIVSGETIGQLMTRAKRIQQQRDEEMDVDYREMIGGL